MQNDTTTTAKSGKVKCGDTRFCEECSTRTSHQDSSGEMPAYLTLNAMGRCDFYRGPNEVRTNPVRVH